MKEPNIEQKAKAYDEAIKVIKDNLDALNEITETGAEVVNIQSIKNCFYRAFPELKESEDERIRKEIIYHIQNCDDTIDEETEKRMIAWLEKQGGNLVENGYTNNKDYIKYADNYSHEIWHKLMDNFKNIKDYHIGCNDVSDIVLNAIIDTCNWLEKQSEQKPTDKVEPKFHPGDWVVDMCGYVWKVIRIINQCYLLKDTDGSESLPTIEWVSKTYHLWTTKDAKDGDVISWDDSKCIALFKNIYDKDSFNSYGFVGHCTGTFEARHGYHDIEGAHPATKEQRDTLMKAITDAGFTFDFEKKELKKIEDEIEIPFAAKDSELQEATYYIPKGFHAEIDDDKVVIKKGEKPTTKREEEERMLNLIIAVFEVNHPNEYFKANELNDPNMRAVYTEEIVAWLKSLKQRIGWKPSKEQIDALDSTLQYSQVSHNSLEHLNSLYNDLMKLKEE